LNDTLKGKEKAMMVQQLLGAAGVCLLGCVLIHFALSALENFDAGAQARVEVGNVWGFHGCSWAKLAWKVIL
jgi:hypothetical protein